MAEAGYFDGKTSRRHRVRLSADATGLELAGDGWRKREPPSAIRVSEPIGGAPRTLTFADGSYCEVQQGETLDALLAALGYRDHAVARWQKSWTAALAGLVVTLAIVAAGYRLGLPWFAEQAAPLVPPAVVTAMSDQVMAMLDKGILAESELPPERQAVLAEGFGRIAAGDPALGDARLLFRGAPKVGPNAFALPDGRIVLLDELVSLAESDEEVLGVLAHELAHVKFRHGLRQLIQSSVVAVIVASYFGDVSSLLSGLTALLLESKYSRRFELEADTYGASLVRRHGMSAEGLAQMLEKMERAHDKGAGTKQWSADWLSTHPDTAERTVRLRGFVAQ